LHYISDDEYDFNYPTYRKQCAIDDELALIDIRGTGEQVEYLAMREHYISSGEGFMLIYSISSRASFHEIRTFRAQILRVKDKDYFPMIIVGNNCDQVMDREVSKQEGMALARDIGCGFIETSAKMRVNVDEAFYMLVREIRRYNRQMSTPSKPQH
jgi:GTPase KRas